MRTPLKRSLLPAAFRTSGRDRVRRPRGAACRSGLLTPEIVLLDLGMPRLDGYDTARSIRAEPWGENVTLIAVTGWGQPKDRDRTLEAGFNAHLVKPIGTKSWMPIIGN